MTALIAGQPAVESLIPHRDPALLVRVVTEVSATEITCIAVIPGDHPLVEESQAPCLLAIEAAAQAAAAFEALDRLGVEAAEGSTGPRIGYLVGVRDAVFHRSTLPAGWPLRVTVRPSGHAAPLAVYDAAVEIDGSPALTATLSTYLAPSEET